MLLNTSPRAIISVPVVGVGGRNLFSILPLKMLLVEISKPLIEENCRTDALAATFVSTKKKTMKSLKISFAATLIATGVFAQNPDQAAQAVQLENDSIFTPQSEWVVKLGFDSHVLVAGRDWDIQQTALMPSVAYYHKSGINGSVTGSILSNTDPKYNQTILNIGYGRALGSHFFGTVGYNRFIFNPNTEGLIQNSVNLFLNYTHDWFSVGASYTALFEPEKAQQLNFSLSGFFEKQDLGIINSLTFTPNLSLLLGTKNVGLQRFSGSFFKKATGARWENRPIANRLPTDFIAPLSLNLAFPLTAQIGHFQWGFSLNYIVPVKSKIELIQQEELNKTLYFSVNVGYKF